jgi:hypothetical protein
MYVENSEISSEGTTVSMIVLMRGQSSHIRGWPIHIVDPGAASYSSQEKCNHLIWKTGV